MKNATRMFALTLTLLPMFAAAQLKSSDKLVANVPFQFKAGDKMIPAGNLIVESDSQNRGNLMIYNVAAKKSAIVSSMPERATAHAGTFALVFHKYGDHYFLAEVRQSGKTIDRLRETGQEAELRAASSSAAEEVLVASRN
jgi:hypothetical protein